MRSFAPPSRPPSDLTLFSSSCPGRACAVSELMLAKVHRDDALLELLTPHAWASALGYAPAELGGRSLSGLLQAGRANGAAVVSALLDEGDAQSVDIVVLGGDAQGRHLRLYRRFDAYDRSIFILADDLSGRSVAPGGQSSGFAGEQTGGPAPRTMVLDGRHPARPQTGAA